MTVTVNSLGSNSAEIVIVNESTALPAMDEVETFITSKGWTRETSLGNSYERIYSSANLTTGTKYIKINALDLHIEHAESYSGTTTVTATNPAFRMVNNDHLDYDKSLFADTTDSLDGVASIVLTDSSTISSTSLSLTVSAGLDQVLYPGQFVRIIRRGDASQWMDCKVVSHNNATGAVSLQRYNISSGLTTDTASDWSILTHQIKDTGAPSYIYVSASARHIAIQIKYNDGVYSDWHAVMETENPNNLDNCSILTTGWMMSNSGYTNNSSGRADTISPTSVDITDNTSSPSLVAHYGSFRLWCGPYSQPRSRLNRTGVTASRFSKISTPLGEAGPVGSEQKFTLGRATSASNSTNVNLTYFIENIVYYKGMADVIPFEPEVTTNNQWAFSGVAVTDLTEDASWTDLSINTWPGFKTNPNNHVSAGVSNAPQTSADQNRWASVREQSSWTPHIPTLLGRIYGITFVTSGLPSGNTLSIKTNTDGFADDNGIAQDYLVMRYQSQFQADSRQGAAQITAGNPMTTLDQADIRKSKSASVAFPK